MRRVYFLYFILGCLISTVLFVQAQPSALGDDRKPFDLTKALIGSVKSLKDVEKLWDNLKAEQSNLEPRGLEIEAEAENDPKFPERKLRMEELQRDYSQHNQDATRQYNKCHHILKKGDSEHPEWSNCQSWGNKINVRKKNLDDRRDKLYQEFFGKNYPEWFKVRGQLAFIDVEIRTLEGVKSSVEQNCNAPEVTVHQCFQCVWDGTYCPESKLPEPLHNRKYKQQLNDLLKNKAKVIAEELNP